MTHKIVKKSCQNLVVKKSFFFQILYARTNLLVMTGHGRCCIFNTL